MSTGVKQYGSVVLTISQLVKDYCIEQGNSNQNHYIKNLVHAKWVWKEIFLTSIWAIKQKIVKVSSDRTITLPSDLMRLVNISVQDECGQLQPLGFNPNMNTLKNACPTSCSCGCGGQGTLCGMVDNIQMRTETININGTDYTKRIWNRTDDAGNLTEVIETPVWDAGEGAIEMVERVNIVCALDTTQSGCIADTKPNRQKLIDHCGCYIPSCVEPLCQLSLPPYKSNYGDWNWDATAKDTIHIKDSAVNYVIVGYQTNGECDGEEIVVPEYSEFAIKVGINYRSALFSRVATISEREQMKREFKNAKTELRKFLNPIRISEFLSIQDRTPQW
jgi:hypothetical protein